MPCADHLPFKGKLKLWGEEQIKFLTWNLNENFIIKRYEEGVKGNLWRTPFLIPTTHIFYIVDGKVDIFFNTKGKACLIKDRDKKTYLYHRLHLWVNQQKCLMLWTMCDICLIYFGIRDIRQFGAREKKQIGICFKYINILHLLYWFLIYIY